MKEWMNPSRQGNDLPHIIIIIMQRYGYYVHPVGPSLHLYREIDNSPSMYISNLLAGSTFHTNRYDVVLYIAMGWVGLHATHIPTTFVAKTLTLNYQNLLLLPGKWYYYLCNIRCLVHVVHIGIHPVPVSLQMCPVYMLSCSRWCRCRLASMATCPLNFPYLLVYTLRLTKSLVALCV